MLCETKRARCSAMAIRRSKRRRRNESKNEKKNVKIDVMEVANVRNATTRWTINDVYMVVVAIATAISATTTAGLSSRRQGENVWYTNDHDRRQRETENEFFSRVLSPATVQPFPAWQLPFVFCQSKNENVHRASYWMCGFCAQRNKSISQKTWVRPRTMMEILEISSSHMSNGQCGGEGWWCCTMQMCHESSNTKAAYSHTQRVLNVLNSREIDEIKE